jgi:hypothetical protein
VGSGCEIVGLDQRGSRARRECGAHDHRHQCNEPGPTEQASSERVKCGSRDVDHAASIIKRRATGERECKLAEIHEALEIERHTGHRVGEKPAKLATAVELFS